MVPAAVAALILAFPVSTSREDPDRFLAALRSHCGKAYVGRVIDPQPADTAFVRQRLVMHVRGCGDTVRIPFHVGDDRSRTWVFTRTSGGVRLKHDHRHQDGSADRITQYGGDSRETGTAERMEFAADSLTAALIPAARTNVWTVEITPGLFVYQLRREGTDRRFRVEVDLSRPVAPPPAPWGERGTIIGVVVDSATQRPMSRSLICLHESNRRTMNCARTDIAGSFRLESIPPGTSDIDVTCASERGLGGLRKLRQPSQSRAAVDSLRLVVSAEGCDTRPLRRISRLFSGFYSSGFEQSQFTPCKADGWYIPSDTAGMPPFHARRVG